MKKIILVFLTSLGSLFASAQTDSAAYHHLPIARVAPLWVINGHILGAANIKPEDIDSMQIVKDIGKFPELKNLDRYGVIFIYLKKGIRIDSKKLSDFKNELHIEGNVQFAVDGYFVNDENLLIGALSISQINVYRPNAQNKLTDVVINVWTYDPGLRNGEFKSTDGQFYIR